MSCKVSFIGLGVMGYPMAGYISKAGHNVTVYNRTKSKAEKWIEEYKGKIAETPEEAAKESDFVFTCVGNDDDLKEAKPLHQLKLLKEQILYLPASVTIMI